MNRVLIVSWAYAPFLYPRAFRWSAITEYLAGKGYRIDVVCAWAPDLPDYELLRGVHVYRVGRNIVHNLRNMLVKQQTFEYADNNGDKAAHPSVKREIKKVMRVLHDYTWKKFYWPDYACLWYFPAKRKAKQLLNEYKYEVLISVSHPFTGHLVGLALKNADPTLSWIADTGDPFCFLDSTPMNNQALFKRLNYMAERKVFTRADSISVTTLSTKDEYKKIFPLFAEKIHVIPPLLSQPEAFSVENPLRKGLDKIRFTFIGTLYKSIRNPDFLLTLFSRLLETDMGGRIELHFYGNINDCSDLFAPYEKLIGSKIFINGVLPRNKITLAMKEADILVNIGNHTPYQLPSKVVEYAAAGKPVLNLISKEDDSSLEFFKLYPMSLSLLNNGKTPIQDQMMLLLQFIRKLPEFCRQKRSYAWLDSFKVESVSSAYERLMRYRDQRHGMLP